MKNEQKRAVDQECILEPFLLKMIDLDTRSKSVLKLRTVFSKFKIKTVGIPTVSWRRARDSNPTFAMAGIVENTGLQRLVKMSVFKSVFKKSPAGLCVLFIQNA